MHKPLTSILSCLAGLLLTGIASAQDNTATQPSKPATPSAQSKPSTAAKKPAATTAKPATGVALTTQKQKNSYALGMNVGAGMRKQGLDQKVDPALVARGLRDALGGAKTAMTEDEMKTTIQALANEFRAAQEAKAKEAGATSRKEGESFLAANKTKEGVKVLPDG